MLVLGIILVLLAATALVAALVGGSDQPVSFDLGIVTVETNALGIFLIGATTVVLLVAGLVLMRSGVRQVNRRRKERQELTRLSQRLEAHEADQRRTTDTDTATHTPTDTPTESLPEVDQRRTTDKDPE